MIDWRRFELSVIPGVTLVRRVRGYDTPKDRQWDWMGIGYEGIYLSPHPDRDDPRGKSEIVWIQPFDCLRDQPVDVHMLNFWVNDQWLTFEQVMA